jgi:hypothetical protein
VILQCLKALFRTYYIPVRYIGKYPPPQKKGREYHNATGGGVNMKRGRWRQVRKTEEGK